MSSSVGTGQRHEVKVRGTARWARNVPYPSGSSGYVSVCKHARSAAPFGFNRVRAARQAFLSPSPLESPSHGGGRM